MTDQLSGKQFEEPRGVEDWRQLSGGGFVCAYFRTGSFSLGAALAEAIGELPTVANHHLEVDLRHDGVSVRLCGHEPWGLSGDDVELARQISAAARELGVPADPPIVQHVQVAIDALAIAEVRPFWRAVLGYEFVGDEDLLDPRRCGPPFCATRNTASPSPASGRRRSISRQPRCSGGARTCACSSRASWRWASCS